MIGLRYPKSADADVRQGDLSVNESDISSAILDRYYQKLNGALRCDVLVVGAGPSGLVASWRLAQKGLHVVLLDKRLSPGGGIWGGSLGMNEVVVEEDAFVILAEAGVRQSCHGSLFVADAAELASALALKAIHAGATFLSLTVAEDLCVHDGRVTGIAANRSLLADQLPIDPMVLTSRATVDATGHEAALVQRLHSRGLLDSSQCCMPGESPMDAAAGERFVVEHAGEVYPGLWITGMSVCAVRGGPRMGPIFGGMLLSGEKVAEIVARALTRQTQSPSSGRGTEDQAGSR